MNDGKLEHLWKPGQSGNPNGRPKGARCKFGEDFVKDFADHWHTLADDVDKKTKGQKLLDRLYDEHPEAYARVACSILPKVIELDDETKDAIQSLSLIPFNVIRTRAEGKSESSTSH